MRHTLAMRRWYLAATAVVLLLSAVALPAVDSPQKRQQARTQFATAESLHQTLNRKPAGQRTRREYQQVIDAYRRVYATSPSSSKADDSVLQVATLEAEEGRAFRDERLLRTAITQYEFLQREYPGSKYRFEALISVGQIYKNDLNEPEHARQSFQDFLKRYPRQQLAAEARAQLAQMDADSTRKRSAPQAARNAQPATPAKPVEASAGTTPAVKAVADARKTQATTAPAEPPRSGLPMVTGIRHWSTPDYTRVAIDIESEVKYEAGRVPSPDRIFFDLHGTKLAAALTNRSIDVSDGFLRKIRVAQYQREMTRVVLEVDDVSDYSAFLLPNPYRLIIDIHGRKPAAPSTVIAKAEAAETAAGKAAGSARPSLVPQAQAAAKTDAAAAKTAAKPAPAQKQELAKVETPPAPPAARAKEAVPAEKNPRPVLERRTESAETPAATPAESKTASLDSAGEAEQKATTQPTTKPTFQSVAPRTAKAAEPAAASGAKPAPNAASAAKTTETASLAKGKSAAQPPVQVRAAQPTSDGERSLIRALGLKFGRIVVDAGHGGHDTGTIGPNGLQEKDLVLDVALRLGKLLKARMGAEVVYTRTDDSFVPLETRTAIANQQQADLFISVHANSSSDRTARGIETYYLNFTSSADALEVAARENAVSEKSIHELQDLVKKIALREKVEESREFAVNVQSSLHQNLAVKDHTLRNRGVKKAPFIVLIGANMPAVLAEIAFVSNPNDARRLQTPEYRQRIAEALYKGITKYVNGLSGVKMAARGKQPQGE